MIRGKRKRDARRTARRVVDKTTGLRSDTRIRLNGVKSAKSYPDRLRRVVFHDDKRDRRLVFLTNNFKLPALTIAQLYRCRWQVELFFKWIKQNLRIKAFYGTTENAVKTQVWIAIRVYVLVAIIKKDLKCDRSLSDILQILSLTLFEKMPLIRARPDEKTQNRTPNRPNHRSLFDL